MSQDYCPIFGRCIPCNDGYECVTQEEIDAWERENGKFYFTPVGGGWQSDSVTSAYNHDLKPGEKGPIDIRIGYTLMRRQQGHMSHAHAGIAQGGAHCTVCHTNFIGWPSCKSDFLAPLTRPTKYFEGQDELVRLLQSLGLNENDLITTVHLVARSLDRGYP
jgi:hypothetical protein